MTTHAQKVAPITRKKRKLKQEFFLGTFEYLDNLGLKKDSIKGGNYWLYYIDETPFFYVRNWSVYIDFRLRELRDLLSQIKGVLPNPKGSSLNHKFEHFKHYRNVVSKKTGEARDEYEGWGFCYIDKAAFEAFVNICTVFQKSGLLAAEEAVVAYELKAAPKTGKATVSESRVGQQKFKQDLLKYWKTCAVTDCSLISVLKASHIKSWTESTPVEKLDPFNGLLLSPNLDCLFDSGLISFDKDGVIMISSMLKASDSTSLGVSGVMTLRKKNGAHEKYLEYHRNSTFKK